jgi:hypothetical protein
MNKGFLILILLALTFVLVTTGHAQKIEIPISLRHIWLDQSYLAPRMSGDNCMLGLSSSLSDSQSESKPPLNALRVCGEITAGSAGGLALLLLPTPLVDLSLKNTDAGVAMALGYLYLLSALAVTYPLGIATGVYLIGSVGDESGSFWAALGGSYIGGLAGAGILLGGDFDRDAFVPALLMAPIAATIAFNITRKREKSSASAAPPISFRVNLARMKF